MSETKAAESEIANADQIYSPACDEIFAQRHDDSIPLPFLQLALKWHSIHMQLDEREEITQRRR